MPRGHVRGPLRIEIAHGGEFDAGHAGPGLVVKLAEETGADTCDAHIGRHVFLRPDDMFQGLG